MRGACKEADGLEGIPDEAEIEQAIFLPTLGRFMYDSEFHEMINDNDNADTLYAIAWSES